MKSNHEYFMKEAMKLALKARGQTSPNPLVGAVVVKNGLVIGRGYHKKAGLAHAEVIALDEAGDNAAGATLYVTFEPCAHYGRTPPCVERIIRSRVKKVVVGMTDPNPLVNGRGAAILNKHGVETETGVLEGELRLINEPFIKYITSGMPFVTVKVGQSLDGRIATRTGDSQWITSEAARSYSHRIRKYYDAIMVGSNTLLRDNPRLDPWFSKKPLTKIIIDSRLSTPVDAQVFASGNPVIVVTVPSTPGQETENRTILAQKARIIEAKEAAGRVNLRDMMKKLARLEITNILVEGGGGLIGSLFDAGLVDKVLFFINPKIIGGKEATGSVMGKGISRLEQAHVLKRVTMRKIGEDFLFEGHVVHKGSVVA